MFAEYLRKSGVSEDHIIQMNFESFRWEDITDSQRLYDAVAKKIIRTGRTYIILDEVQMVQGWSKAIDSFLVDFDIDIYITGSNTYLLSSEFSTLLSGRYVEIRMLPLSFREFLDFNTFASDVSVDEKFQKYLQFGGMPVLSEYDFNQERINDVLQGIYSR